MEIDQIITNSLIGLHLIYLVISYVAIGNTYDKKVRDVLFISQLFCLLSLLNYLKFKGLM